MNEYEQGSIDAANAIIGWVGKSNRLMALDILRAWESGAITEPPTPDPAPLLMDKSAARIAATSLGFTGDACDHCGSMKMNRTGHCATCAECGTTTGCS